MRADEGDLRIKPGSSRGKDVGRGDTREEGEGLNGRLTQKLIGVLEGHSRVAEEVKGPGEAELNTRKDPLSRKATI
jgi:hypothetical protein